jgi:hypothetical protein
LETFPHVDYSLTYYIANLLRDERHRPIANQLLRNFNNVDHDHRLNLWWAILTVSGLSSLNERGLGPSVGGTPEEVGINDS